MSRLADLLSEFCHDGVPVRTLGTVGDLVRGNGMPKSDFVASGVGAIHYGQIYTRYGLSATKTYSFVSPATASRLAKVDHGDLVITNTSENVEDVGKAVAWLGSEQVVTGGHATVLKHGENPKYLAYWFQSEAFTRQKRRLATGTKVLDVSARQLGSVRVPVPARPVQDEIVRLLDPFEELIKCLSAELDARVRQYALYRDSLMAFGDEVAWSPIGELATVVRGASPRPIQSFLTDAPDGVPWIKIGDVPADGKYITQTAQRVTAAGAAKSRIVEPGDFVLSNSMSFGRPYVCKIRGAIHDGWLAISEFEGSFNRDFLYHLLRSGPIQTEFARRAGSGTVSNLNAEIVRSVRVPVPKRRDQDRIAEFLDAFDALVNDGSGSIRAEIAARRRQFVHYRDRLFAFEESAA